MNLPEDVERVLILTYPSLKPQDQIKQTHLKAFIMSFHYVVNIAKPPNQSSIPVC